MEINVTKVGSDIAVVESPEVIISSGQDALDLMVTLQYDHGCRKAVIDKANISEDFFRLRTGLAGEVLQKLTTYGFPIAIVGDFSVYDSKSLRDFIYESNKGRQVFFARDRQEAIELLETVHA